MAKKKTQEQFEKEIHEKYPQIQIRGKYNGSNERVNVHCNIDEYDWNAYPNNLLTYGCPCCNGRVITTQSFKNEIAKLHPEVEIIGEWNGIDTPISCRCKECNFEWNYKPHSIRTTGCPRCNGSATRKWTHEEYVEKINELFDGNIVVLGYYKNMNTKILHKCNKHNYEYMMNPIHALRRQGCKLCGYEITSEKRTKPLDVFLQQLHEKRGNEYSYISGYVNSSTNATFRHNMADGTYHDFVMTPNSMISSKYNCPCCSGYQVYKGYNDFNTKRPELAQYLVNYQDGYKYTEWSSEELEWKCPSCGNIMKKKISYVSKYGVTCPRCDDGYSYPNKFIYNSLLQIENQLDFLDREYRPDWCKYKYKDKNCYGIYDIYFEKNNKKFVIEMDGGLGHGNRSYTNSKTNRDELIFRDKEKDRLASEHNIKVIRIDCNYETNDRYQFILNNILKSELSNILDLSKVNFNQSNTQSQQSLFIKAVELWNLGENISQIKSELHIHESTVTSYIKSALKYNMCDYSVKESRRRSYSNAVVCITTGKEFKAIVDGAKYYNIDPGDISKCCRRTSTFGGWYNGQKMIWMYKKDYDEYPKDKLSEYIPKENDNYTKIVCLNTGEVFDGLIYAAEKYHMKKGSGISACCKGRYHFAGKDDNGIPLVWRYLSDYKNMNQDEIDSLINYKLEGKKQVICLNTKDVFDNALVACKWCGLESKLPIQRVCRGETKTAGMHPLTKEKLSWMYYKDYKEIFGEAS
nr:MAG TPA: restriction enzyme [Caudoviricetes sp.]